MTTARNSKWRVCKLDELGFVGRGRSRHRPRNAPALYGGDYPFVQTGDIKAANLYIRDYSQTYNDFGLKQSKLWEAGTLCITIAANIAETAILGIRACFPDSIIGFVPHPDKSDARYIKYQIDQIKLQMQQVSHGTTQDNLSLDKLLSFDFISPPVSLQRKIAYILSAYDDLIENNLRRIKILEEMAQALYREWFVKFRFPGHEKVRMVDSPLGKIPEGWEVVSLKEEIEVTRGLSYSGKYLTSSGIPMHNLNSVREGGGYKYSGIKYYSGPFKDKDRVVPGDILVANTEQTWDRLLIAYAAMVPRCFGKEGIYSHHLYRVRPKPKSYLSKIFIYLMLNEDELRDWISRFGNGTTVNMLPRDALERPTFVRPPSSIVDKISDSVSLMFRQAESLHEKSENLRRTRDLLLPKLISGELDVRSIETSIGG